MYRKIGVYLILSVFLIQIFAVPVVGQSQTAQDVLRVITSDLQSQQDVVQDWLNSSEADEYPDLKTQAENWLGEKEQEREEIQSNMSGYKSISDNIKVIGYDFDRTNETAEIAIEADERTNIVLQDMGATVAGNGFSYRTETVSSGVSTFRLEAVEANVNNVYTQQIAVIDSDAKAGNTVSRTQNASLWNEIEWWMIPLGALTGGVTGIVIMIKQKSNLDNEGENEFIPLE